MTRGEQAARNFCSGCNCCQSVLVEFARETGLDESTAMKLASGFGGGMGRLREVCGAVTAAFMVISMVYGGETVPSQEEKCGLYARIQELAGRFKEKNRSIVCREMLAGIVADRTSNPEPRTPEYYKKRPCATIVRDAADLLEQYLRENPY